MDAREAEAVRRALADIDQVRSTTRSRIAAFWFPQVAFGGAMLLAGLGGLAVDGGLGFLMLAASVVASALVVAFYRRRGSRIGLRTRSWPSMALTAAGVVACTAAAISLPVRPDDVGPWLAAAVIYLGFGLLQRAPAVALWSLVVTGIAVAVAVLAPDARPGVLTCVEGTVALAAGAVLRLQRPAR